MTPAEVLALPAVVNIVMAGRVLGLGSSLSYDLARRDEFPVPVIKVGTRPLYRVPLAGLLEVLGLTPDNSEAGVPTPALALATDATAARQEVPRAG